MKSRVFKITAKATKTLYLATATGVAGFTLHTANPTLIPFSNDSPIVSAASDFTEKITTGFHGVLRSSRAVYTITLNIVDYKYSLHGLPWESEEYRRTLSEVHLRSAKRILKLCEANKGFYVKAGQFVAALRQVPKEYSSTLSSLQDQAVPCEFKAIKRALINNLGQDLSEVFLAFNEQPTAAASIAQVHHAVLKDHQEVAVKVQYPGLENQMKFDVRTMAILSNCVAWIFPEYRFKWIVSEFEKTISLELDFVQEGKNSERTAKNFKKNKMVKVPRVFWDLTSRQVLTMEFCNGHKVDDLESMKEFGINPTKVAKALVEVFAEMIFVHGFVHGDPHPGNILVSPNGPNGFSLVLLDHGIYKELDEEFRLDYCQLWVSLILLDSNKIQELGERFGVGKYSMYFPVIFTGRTIDSKSALGRGMSNEERKKLKQELESISMGDFSSFMETLSPNFLTILRADGLVKSTISKLGASQRLRLLVYAKYAAYGLSTELNTETGYTVRFVFSRFKKMKSYIQLRLILDMLELHLRMEDLAHLLMNKLKNIWLNLGYFLAVIHSLLA
ncbi:aarF domain-containing protein kinase 1 isoform X1 [Macadamia integrifolia]|uniref:aarF domain-containing protein kinase 1 isoform X1 n=1 Tax=Macadamia integrifolia TaxID=60698 RepID=UPI001C4F9DEB|nr:aarF domain-containing protein kinase 1 isoform X1 [Macadamia integrifolia]